MKKSYKAACIILLSIFAASLLPNGTAAQSPLQGGGETAETKAPFVRGRILVGFRPEVSSRRARQLVKTFGARHGEELSSTGVHIVELPDGADEEFFLNFYKSHPDVAFAELDHLIAPDEMIPNDPDYQAEWHLPKISAPSAWASTVGNNSIIIAILDSGVDGNHPDLAPKIVPGWNCYDNNPNTADVSGHGTAVAGSAAAASNNSLGVASVAWGCRIMPVRITNASGWGSVSAIANGLIWAADHGARVANISYQATNYSSVTSAAQYFYNRGGVVTISAGNSATFDPTADNPYVLTVSGTSSSDAMASWSNTGNNVDIASPGVAIQTTNRGGGYSPWSGTSFSAPIVAGVAGLVLSANPGLTAAQAQLALKQGADDLGASGWDPSYGWGRVNASRAVALATGGGAPPDTTPPSVSFTSPSTGDFLSGVINVQANASDNNQMASVSLSVDATTLQTLNAAPYTFSWNTATVADGVHTLTATATDGAGNRTSASVLVRVNNEGDNTAPSVVILSPSNGTRVAGSTMVSVNATDDERVMRVELYIDGQLKDASNSAFANFKWNTKREAPGTHTLWCKAYDAAGNVGTSLTVTVIR